MDSYALIGISLGLLCSIAYVLIILFNKNKSKFHFEEIIYLFLACTALTTAVKTGVITGTDTVLITALDDAGIPFINVIFASFTLLCASLFTIVRVFVRSNQPEPELKKA